MEQLKIKRDHQLGLMESLAFSEKDLDANRDNQLSDNQRRKLRQYQILGACFWWVLAGFGVFLLLLSSRRFPDHVSDQFVSLIIVALGVGMAFWQQHQTNQALKDNGVDVITAAIRTTKRYENNRTIYRAFLDEKKFEISKTTYERLVQGQYYSFYYVPQSGQLLTIEVTLTPEEKRLMEAERISALKKQKRLVEPDTLMSDAAPVEDNAVEAHTSE